MLSPRGEGEGPSSLPRKQLLSCKKLDWIDLAETCGKPLASAPSLTKREPQMATVALRQ
jgi:hypothetical protein